jgi:hypothetical protein
MPTYLKRDESVRGGVTLPIPPTHKHTTQNYLHNNKQTTPAICITLKLKKLDDCYHLDLVHHTGVFKHQGLYDQTVSQLELQRGLLFFKDQSWSLVRLATESHPTLSEQGIL